MYMNILIKIFLISFFLVSRADIPSDLFEKILETNGKTFYEKLDKYSSFLLGKPYGNPSYELVNASVLNNSDDLIKYLTRHEFVYDFNKFDCVTYLETILALSLSGDLKSLDENDKKSFTNKFEIALKHIRYKEGLDYYFHRNHFTSIDWIPNNNWLFEDVTKIIYRDSLEAQCEIKKPAWAFMQPPTKEFLEKHTEKSRDALKLEIIRKLSDKGFDLQEVKSRVNYIPLKDYLEKADIINEKFPMIGIVNIVRPAWDLEAVIGTKLNISHQGLILKKNGRIVFRHATTEGNKEVVEVLLDEYLKQFLNSPTIKGINIISIKVPEDLSFMKIK